MGMTKYQSVEKAEVLSPEEHERIGTELRRLGKTNANPLQGSPIRIDNKGLLSMLDDDEDLSSS